MPTQKTGVIYDRRMQEHKSKKAHPEKPERISAIMVRLEKSLLLSHPRVEYIQGIDRSVSKEELMLAHPEQYVDYIANLWPKVSHRKDITILDTYFSQGSHMAAKLAVAGLLQAVDNVIAERWRNAFAVIRPPGHHSGTKHTINGFCVFNNVAIAARYLLSRHGKARVAIVDWDVHHGDGTQHIFQSDPNVLFISIHRHDRGAFYPVGDEKQMTNCGTGSAEGTKINLPFDCVDQKFKSYIFQTPGDNEYIYLFKRLVEPILLEFDPEFILVSCGFDAARNDPLGGMTLTPNGYFYMAKCLGQLEKPLVVVLQGGYDLESVSESAEAVMRGLLDEEELPEPIEGVNCKNISLLCCIEHTYLQQIEAMIKFHSRKWGYLSNQDLQAYTHKIHNNATKVFGVVSPRKDSSSSSSLSSHSEEGNKDTRTQLAQNIKQEVQNKKQELSSDKQELRSYKQRLIGNQTVTTESETNSKSDSVAVHAQSAVHEQLQQEQVSSQFHFAAGHLQNFKHFGSKSKQLYKLVDHSERAFYESEFPEKEFAPKYYGSDGDFIILDNLLYEMKNHVVMDIKMSRKSKRQECGEEKVLKEKAKEKQSTSEKYGFRIIGFTTPDRKEGGILTSDEDVVGRLLRIVVTKDNQSRFCEFLQAMSQLLRTVHRRYFNTSIVLIKGDTRSDIKWIDFRYWEQHESEDHDLLEGLDNLRAFILGLNL